MLILEGPNQSGKTTLCKELRSAWGHRRMYIREYKRKDRLWYSGLAQVMHHGSWVVDRCWLTELIYHKICRYRLDQLYYLSLLTDVYASMMFILLPPEIELAKRGGKLFDKPEGSEFTLAELWRRYNLLSRNRLFITTIDGFKVRADALLPTQTVFWTQKEQVNLDAYRPWYQPAMGQRELYRKAKFCGVGNLNPVFLFLGDRVNPNVSKSPTLEPLMPISRAACGAYLMRVLYYSGIDLRLVHVHNAYKPNNALYSKQMLHLLNPEYVIAMGDKAHASIEQYGWDCKEIRMRHPQYLRRFRSSNEKGIGRSLYVEIRNNEGLAKHFPGRDTNR